nr:methyltransferase [uncultured Roseateles sp.]
MSGGSLDAAFALHRAGRLDEAAAAYGAIAPDDGLYLDALHLLGIVAGQQGRHGEAVELLTRVTAQRPDFLPALSNLGNAQLAAGQPDAALASFEVVLASQAGDLFATRGRARSLYALGRLGEALAGYDATLALEPGCVISLMQCGDVLLRLGRHDEGVQLLQRALALGADPQRAQHMRFVLATVGEDAMPEQAPTAYVKELFDGYAEGFDQALVQELDYRTPQLLAELLADDGPGEALMVLDLGCGTGLCGPWLRPLAARLVGVDLSDRMLDKARQRGLYDALDAAELTAWLEACSERFDLVVAADVFVYLGDLSAVFADVRRLLRPGGRFLFSVEAAQVDEVELAQTRRYRHALPYLQRLAEQYGFTLLRTETAALRRNQGADVMGHLLLMQLA